MTTIHLRPEELDGIIDTNLLRFIEVTMKHLPCLCKKKMHKNCPRHVYQHTAQVMFDQRQPIGDKILHLKSKKAPGIILPGQ